MAHQRIASHKHDETSKDRDSKFDSKIFDFTKRKRWPDLLVTELTGVVILVLSNVGKLLFCGEAAKELLGWKDEVVDLKISDLIHPEDEPAFAKAFEDCLVNAQELNIFLRFRSFLPNNGADAVLMSRVQYPLFEIRGHPHYITPSEDTKNDDNPECKCFFAMARPYPTKHMVDLHGVPAPHNNTLGPPAINRQDSDEDFDGSYRPPAIHALPIPNQVRTSFAVPSASRAQLSSDVGSTKRRNTAPELAEEEEKESAAARRKKRKALAAENYVCVTCGRTDSPEWRKGPLGPKTLCNACGLRHSKRTKKRQGDDDTNLITGSGNDYDDPPPSGTSTKVKGKRPEKLSGLSDHHLLMDRQQQQHLQSYDYSDVESPISPMVPYQHQHQNGNGNGNGRISLGSGDIRSGGPLGPRRHSLQIDPITMPMNVPSNGLGLGGMAGSNGMASPGLNPSSYGNNMAVPLSRQQAYYPVSVPMSLDDVALGGMAPPPPGLTGTTSGDNGNGGILQNGMRQGRFPGVEVQSISTNFNGYNPGSRASGSSGVNVSAGSGGGGGIYERYSAYDSNPPPPHSGHL
ncbi:blue light receptor [Tulasnella sp. 330]|nr:blue light receptor [Tulasnella sp. 330]